MTGFSPNTRKVIDNGFGGSRGGAAITGAIIHHAAGFDALRYVAGWNSRNSHPTYHVDRNGRQTGIVHPNRRPFSTANGVDAFAITFEIDNISGAPDWRVSDEAMETVAETLKWHAEQSPRRGRPLEVNNVAVTQRGFFVGNHSQYVATACPGPFLKNRIDDIVRDANDGAAPTNPKPPTTPAGNRLLVVDGVWGPATTLRLQKELAEEGHNPGALDGQFGPKTTAALQRKLGVTPDGVFGPISKRALQGYLGVERDARIGRITVRTLQSRLNADTF